MKFLSLIVISSFLAIVTAYKAKYETNATKQIAVMITGLVGSFNWENTYDMLIKPVTAQGYGVHFYVLLAAHGNGKDYTTVKNETPSPVDLNSWQKEMAETPGVEFKSVEILSVQETEIPSNAPQKFGQYPPKSSPIGRNLLR